MIAGRYRTFPQDPLLPFRLLADICLRAPSPAVNDPATARQALEAAADLLRLAASRDLAVGVVDDRDGVPRVILELPGWADDVIEAAARSPMALREAVSPFGSLAESVPVHRRRQVRARLDRAQQLLRDGSPSRASGAAAPDARP